MVTQPEKFDLSSIKLALEHATFKDFNIRDGINTLLKSVELDLEEIGFEPSDNTKEVVEALENIVSEVESGAKPHTHLDNNDRVEVSSDDVENVIVIATDDEDEEESPVVNVDEELEEFDG